MFFLDKRQHKKFYERFVDNGDIRELHFCHIIQRSSCITAGSSVVVILVLFSYRRYCTFNMSFIKLMLNVQCLYDDDGRAGH